MKIRFFQKPITDLEIYKEMDNIRACVKKVERYMRETKGLAENRYWHKKWEELVLLHMDFEWFFHTDNKESE